MKRSHKCIALLISAATAVLLAACGGGGSSSSGAGAKAATPFAGQYAGVENLTLIGPGGAFPIGILPLSVAIDATGGVLVTDSDGIPYTGRLGDPVAQLLPNQFIATALISIPTTAGVSCAPSTFGYLGSITGDLITGTAAGSFSCLAAGGVAATLVLGGPFNATRIAGAAPAGPGVTAPAPQPQSGGFRKSRKQQDILEGMNSVF